MKISQMNKKFINKKKRERIKSFRSSFTIEKKIPSIDIQNYTKILESFPNACIVYRIILIVPIRLLQLVSIKRKFSKLKLIKLYLRSTMS